MTVTGTALVFGWAIIATSILAVDRISTGGTDAPASHAEAAFEQRLETLSAERDARAAEAKAAQDRFLAALEQVSQMQSQLLDSEQRRSELEAGFSTVRSKLSEALAERTETERILAEHLPTDKAADAKDAELSLAAVETSRAREVFATLDILSGELRQTADARQRAEKLASEAERKAQALEIEKDTMIARNDRIFAQLEDAVEISIEPFDKMFAAAGLDADRLLKTVRSNYSGQGGPLTPMSHSTRGNAAISEGEARAQEILVSLDHLNSYRIAATKVPLAMPLKSAFRYTSPFGKRWGRMHNGVDMAAPTGTPVYTTGDGVVTFAGWQNGYGNVIKIKHALGTETRYGHLSKIHVKAGQEVSRGARIGDIGNTGRSTGPHLHYEVRVNDQAVNPLSFIKAAQNVF